MSEFSGFYALWQRELKIYLRERSRIVSSAINPLLWLFVFGAGLGSSVSIGEGNYQTFIYPGIIVMTVIFSSIFYGAYVVWDKKLDFLKEVLVSPIRRSTVFLGKVMGGATDGVIQATIMLILAPLFGVKAGLAFALVYLFLFILVVSLVSIGLIIGSLMESPEGFGLLSSFVTFPIFFLSGALFPVDEKLPVWLQSLVKLNPLTYSVDGVRGALISVHIFPFYIDLAVITIFAVVMFGLGSVLFSRMK
jgi:ABC-2 type transport system permease protein